MFAMAVHYLTGRAVGKRYNSHVDADWPPEPGRLYYALVNALHAGGNAPNERGSLLWLETQPPPCLSFSASSERSAPVTFVPPNDVPTLPDRRSKRARQFPSVTPESPLVYFIWPDANLAPGVLESLRSVAGRVAYLGHSSSLVAVSLCDNPPVPRIEPDPDGAWGNLRVPRPGLLDALEKHFARYAEALARTKGSAPRLPLPTSFARYAEVHAGLPASAAGEFSELHILALPPGCRLPLTATLRITDVLRDAAMSLAEQPPLEELSGHTSDGEQSRKNRAAFLALPHVGSRYADGHLMGVGVALPPLEANIRKAVLAPISRLQRLTLGQAGAWDLSPSLAGDARGLQPATWTRPSRRWSSITPVVLHRHPKRRGQGMEEIIVEACAHAGLPAPSELVVMPAAQFEGGADARAFRGIAARPHIHVLLGFDRPVRGPLLIGAGRYRGYGLCRPLEAA